MSDLTNQINELFDGAQQPQQESVVEEIVEEIKPERKPHVYKKLEKPRIAKRETPAHVVREQKEQTNFSINESIDQLFAAADREEVQEFKDTLLPPKQPTEQELKEERKSVRHQRNMQRAGAAITMLESKKKDKPLPIIREDKSVHERLAILEQDLFTQMSNATPNTLVSGIGASLDSGGGAVWLWDLEDVSIGVPSNGTYPSITNGSILKFNAAANQWDIGTPGTSSGVTTDDVFLANPVTLLSYQASLQTLPPPDNDVTTQTDANQWFQKAILYLDEQIGGEDGNLETSGNIDFVSTDVNESIRRYNNAAATLTVQVGADENSLSTTFQFEKGTTTAFVPLEINPASAQAVGGTVDLFSVGKTNTDNSETKVFNVSIDETEVLNKATFKRTSGTGISGFNVEGVVQGTTATTGNLFYVSQSSDTATLADSVKYYGAIVAENDLATKKYVDDNAGAGGVSSIVAGTGVTLSPTSGTGDVTINAGVDVYLPLTGGTMTGQLEMKNDISFTGSGRRIKFKDNTYNSLLFTCADGTDYFGLDSQNETGDGDHSMFYYVHQNFLTTVNITNNLTFSGDNFDFNDENATSQKFRRYGTTSATIDFIVEDAEADLAAATPVVTIQKGSAQYLGTITTDDDIATKKYVDDNAGSGGGGVTKLVAGSNVSLEPTSGVGEVTINASGSGSGGWSLQGTTTLTGNCDIDITNNNNALRFVGNSGSTIMMRFKDVDDEVEFNSIASFNSGVTIPGNQEIILEDTVDLVMKDGAGTAFEMRDASNNIFMRVNTAGTPGFTFYENLMSQNDTVRCKFQAYEPPGGSHFYLQTTDADALDFVDSDTNEIYLRFNTNSKAVQISDADVELDVTGTTNTGRLETLNWYVENGLGVADAGHIYIQDDDGAAFDIQNTAGGNPHLRFKTTDSAEATLFYYPIQTSNASLILGSDGTITTSATATFNGAIVHDPSSNAAVDFGANDGSSARSMVRFNRRLANLSGQTDFIIRGYRPGETTVKDIFQVVNNNPDTAGDEILYYGEVTDSNSIQTKASVDALIAASGGGVSSNLTQGGVIQKNAGSTDNSGNLIIKSGVGYNNYLRLQSQGGNNEIELATSTGDISMGANFTLGNANNKDTAKTIKVWGQDNATATVDFSLSTDGSGTSFTDIFQISPTQVTSGKNFAVTNSIPGSTLFLVDGSNGNVSMGSNFIIGSHSTGTANAINAVGTSGQDGDLTINSYQTVSGSNNSMAKFTVDEVLVYKDLKIGQSGSPVITLGVPNGNISMGSVLNIGSSIASQDVRLNLVGTTGASGRLETYSTANNSDYTLLQTLSTGNLYSHVALKVGPDVNTKNAEITVNGDLSANQGTFAGSVDMQTNKITNAGDPTVAQDVATKNYVDTHPGSGTAILALDNTFTGVNTFEGNIIGENGLQLKKIETANGQGPGALSFHWQSNTTANQKAYILIQGAGTDTSGTDPGELIIARDTTPNNVSDNDKFLTYFCGRGNGAVKTVFNNTVEVPTPTANAHAATKEYVDSHSNAIEGGQQSGTWTATFDGPSAPSSKQTATGHYRKIGDLTHVTLHVNPLNLSGYSNEIRITGLPFKPDTTISGGFHIGKIHGVNFMVNNAHADDGLVAVANYDSTYGNNIEVFSEQVAQKTHYLNSSSAQVTISITYIAE